MASKKVKTETTPRAAISRERRLALALRAVLDTFDGPLLDRDGSHDEVVDWAEAELDALGYGSLIGIPKRMAELNDQLKAALEAEDGKRIAELGLEMQRVQAGRDVKEKE